MFEIDSQTLLSGRVDRYFRWAAWAEVALFLAGAFIWYCYYLSVSGRASPLQYEAVRILVGAVGAAGGLGGVLLWKGMWTYWRYLDPSSKAEKGFWFAIMGLFVVFGCAAYYQLVYRRWTEGRKGA